MSQNDAANDTFTVCVTWDTDGEPADLPTYVAVPVICPDDDLADVLSDAFGFCVLEIDRLTHAQARLIEAAECPCGLRRE